MSETITKKDLRTVFWRSYQALGCYTYDKQQGISYMRALLPVLTKLYPDKEKLKEALNRHNTMFNTTCALVPFCLGITCAMEEEYANAPEGSFDPQSITDVKVALMGPLAGIGDGFFWGDFSCHRLRRRRAARRVRQHSGRRSLLAAESGSFHADALVWFSVRLSGRKRVSGTYPGRRYFNKADGSSEDLGLNSDRRSGFQHCFRSGFT